MESTEWVAPYSREIDLSQQRQDSCSAILAPYRSMSHDFGVLLYDSLEHPQSPLSPDADKFFRKYNNDAFPEHVQRKLAEDLVNAAANPDDLRRAFNEFHFHVLNRSMIALWRPVLKRAWTSEPTPDERLQRAQDLVAHQGLWAYQRHRYTPRDLPDDIIKARDAGFIGMVNESDTAIVLIEAIRRIRKNTPEHDKLTVIAGPYQFEHGPIPDLGKNINVDFVLVEPRGDTTWVLGAQAKANVKREDRRDYDQSRMLLIGAKNDFEEQPPRVIPAIGADDRTESWGGRICAEAALSTPTHGRGASVITGERGVPNSRIPEGVRYYEATSSGPTFIQSKGLARELMRDQVPALDQAARKVADAILEKM